uniref:Uncharacterized protein n=1 Tax=Micrurus corallinus TaxID=54390 RepID=A0A2D4FYS6_MICCO
MKSRKQLYKKKSQPHRSFLQHSLDNVVVHSARIDLCVGWWRHEFELGSVHEDGAVERIVQLVQERSGGALNPMVFRDDVQVAWRGFWSIGDVEVHPTHLGAGLAGHAGIAAAEAGLVADDQGQLQDDLLGAGDADVDLQEILHSQDVAAQNGRLDLPDSERLSPPGLGHAGGDVVASDAGELLGEHLGLPIGQVGVLGHNGRLGHHDPGAGVLKVSIDADVITFTESFAVNPGTNRDAPVWDEHTRNFLLLFGRDGRHQIWRVDVNLIHDFEALLRLLSWEGGAIQEGLHPVIHTAILALKGGAEGPLGQFKFKLVLVGVSRSQQNRTIFIGGLVLQLEHRFVAQVLHLLLALLGPPDPQHARHPTGQEAHGRDTRDLGHLHFHATGHLLAAGIHAAVLFEVQPERLDPLKNHHGFGVGVCQIAKTQRDCKKNAMPLRTPEKLLF